MQHKQKLGVANILAADIGFGTTTACTGDGRVLTTRSLVIRCSPDMANYSDETGHYLVGDDAIPMCDESRGSTDSSYFKSDTFRVLLMYMAQELKVKNPVVATGLPNELFDSETDAFKERIRGFSKYLPNNDQFNKIIILRQPVGAIWSPTIKRLDGSEWSDYDARIAVLDGGDGSFDACQFYKFKLFEDTTVGGHIGVSDIHREILADVRKKYNLDARTTLHDIDAGLRKGKFSVGLKEIDLRTTKGYKAGLASYVSKVSDKIAGWNTSNKIDYFLLNGGIVSLAGAQELADALKLPSSKVLVSTDPSVAIALGYMQYCLTALQANK